MFITHHKKRRYYECPDLVKSLSFIAQVNRLPPARNLQIFFAFFQRPLRLLRRLTDRWILQSVSSEL